MTEERKHEQTPWSPQIESVPLFNPFENPQQAHAEPRDPVALLDQDSQDAEPEQEAPK
jgi:hypothetical protein